MKKSRFFFAALAFIAALASCTPEEQPSDKPDDGNGGDGGKDTPVEVEKSKECKLISFAVTVDGEAVEVFMDPTDNTIELSYLPLQYKGLMAAKAVVEISPKATISPDPTEPHDYTTDAGLEYTVTAEDGTTKEVYTVYCAPAEVKQSAEKKWDKSYGILGLTQKSNNDCGVAFVDKDKVAFACLKVIDLDGNPVGTLNTEGITGLGVYVNGVYQKDNQLAAMYNDDNGVLVAITSYEGQHVKEDTNIGCITEFYAWLDGWDKAPTLIYGPVEYQCMYMSVAGDVKGDFVLNFRTGSNSPMQMHHVLVFKGGKYFKDDGSTAATWYGPMIPHPGTDGCWGQQLSFFTSDPNDGFVCWDSLGAGEYEDWNLDDAGNPIVGEGNASTAVYYYSSLSGFQAGTVDEVPLWGMVTWGEWAAEGKHFLYGNHSYGHARAFVYKGEKCVIVSSNAWSCGWLTIQKAENIVEDDPDTEEVNEYVVNYLLKTWRNDKGSQYAPPSAAYIYDAAAGVGHVIYSANGSNVVAFDLTSAIL